MNNRDKLDYDIIVIGAGIQGVGVAQAASSVGYRVLLLEQYAKPAQGTSSRSSKLIHGGLRYLETGQFSLVKECLLERKRLLKNAPHLVKLVPFYIPIYKKSYYSSLKVALGLSLYSLISLKPFRRIPKKNWPALDGLRQDDLVTVYQYYDAQTHDEKLTQAVLNSAKKMGTQALFNSIFTKAETTKNSCTTYYQHGGINKKVTSHAIVNASGPWVENIAEKVTTKQTLQTQPDVDLVQGTHIEVPGTVFQGVYYLEAPQDKRAVFVMPWQGHLLIGTTETPYSGDPARVQPLEDEVDYLLAVYNHYFSNKIRRTDVINSFAGLRILPKGNTKAFSRPRDTLITGNIRHKPRLLTLYGGKLTAYRATAEQVVKKLSPVLPKPHSRISTKTLCLKD